jgi:hypothetical protein
MWLREEDHYQIVKDTWQTQNRHITNKLNYTLTELHNWGMKKFGCIPRKIKKITRGTATTSAIQQQW